MSKRTRCSAPQRRKLVGAFRASGLSQTRFSKRHGMSTTTLGRWLREFPEGAAFVEVTAPSLTAELVLEFDRGKSTRPFAAGRVVVGMSAPEEIAALRAARSKEASTEAPGPAPTVHGRAWRL